ncbi:hypothetical protein GCM10009535_48270 [Streptomyces thermocarboxydovorans]|uniref:Uncharacterized protein n=1 Tax=Streptomyces thermocarboxydovorans TaxID=59298 RepID=A0ABP3STD4_9ACTN
MALVMRRSSSPGPSVPVLPLRPISAAAAVRGIREDVKSPGWTGETSQGGKRWCTGDLRVDPITTYV